jgi:hypothetical protein
MSASGDPRLPRATKSAQHTGEVAWGEAGRPRKGGGHSILESHGGPHTQFEHTDLPTEFTITPACRLTRHGCQPDPG